MTPTQRYAIQTEKVNNRYTMILDTNDLYNNFVSAHRDLSYPLRKEVKRDRYIMNSAGLEKDIEKVIDEAIQKAATPLIDLVSTEIANEAYSKLEAIHNGVSGSYIKNTSKINNIGSILGKALGKSIVEGVTQLLNDN
ncbi:MAG: hypothetical protein NC200_04450 [Candidatus Gastranaerophilales bacterium]|nr:hypothetical protein [Candidatus Gastranaerophilales bacterium]